MKKQSTFHYMQYDSKKALGKKGLGLGNNKKERNEVNGVQMLKKIVLKKMSK